MIKLSYYKNIKDKVNSFFTYAKKKIKSDFKHKESRFVAVFRLFIFIYFK